ncbi:HipA domain-containing protein [Piscinibacter sp.]|uniref:HipA domain-containing protein n=1 Tax=Piscinibacter sp. TaxID=1903157 RepID=UPI002C8C482A|nr:HipA domain-containing protein [Albitalea sp.]HUG26202.1 HipA domain-containing protein [Albitalea sp.]
MADTLYLSSDGQGLGTLEDNAGIWRLTYAPEWIGNPNAFPLSPHLVLRAKPYDDRDEDGMVEKFFDNLLPEGDARIRLEKRLSARNGDSFDLLRRFGRETAGAVTMSTSPELKPEDSNYAALPRPEFLARVRRMRQEGGSLLEAARMSLAGAQDKTAVRMDPHADVELLDGLLEPEDQAPTTHILKPQPPLSRKLDHVAVNEFFCMTLARRAAGNAPEAHLLFAPGPDDGDDDHSRDDALEWVYCVQRFDRTPTSSGGIRRLHQIDFLQLRNEWASTMSKYEKSGGAKLELMFKLAAKNASAPAAAINALLHGRIISFLVGDADAHWKNRSLMWSSGRWNVSPLYDVVCTFAYPGLDATPAMTIGGCEDERKITADHFKAFFAECIEPHGSKVQAVTLALRTLGTSVPREAHSLYDSIAPRVGPSNAAFLHDKVLPVIGERSAAALEIAAALAPPRAVRRHRPA